MQPSRSGAPIIRLGEKHLDPYFPQLSCSEQQFADWGAAEHGPERSAHRYKRPCRGQGGGRVSRPESRTVLLRDDHGDLETIIASPEVRNLAQVHPGDHVLVSVHRSVALEMSKPGSAPVTAVEETAVQAKPGMKPAAYRGQTVQARVQILNIDLDHRTVSFVGPARILRVVEITDPRLLEFVRTLHEGDEVDVTYRLGIAARVVPAQG